MRLLEMKLQHMLQSSLFFVLFGLFSCIFLSVVYDFEEATRSHCKVSNYIPSISTAIGDFTPQRYIWRICIALHCFPRLLIPLLFYNYYRVEAKKPFSAQFRFLNGLNSFLTIVENFALLIITCVSSSENFGVHENAFILFMFCSMCYMLTTCILFKWTSKKPMTDEETHLFKRELTLMFINYTSFALAIYFYFRHEWYCEPGIYSIFALFEYSAVLSNICFHYQSYSILMESYFIVANGHRPLEEKGTNNE